MGRAFEFRKARKMKRWSAMAKTFTRIGKDIVMAVKEGGPNPESNSRLRAVIQNAKAANMPKENVERAIKKASDKDSANFKEVLFEGYAPHGIAILIETATDNNNRTVANIRSYFLIIRNPFICLHCMQGINEIAAIKLFEIRPLFVVIFCVDKDITKGQFCKTFIDGLQICFC